MVSEQRDLSEVKEDAMRPATSEELYRDFSFLPENARISLRKHRTNPALSGSDRALFRAGVPQNPMRILEVASKLLSDTCSRANYGITSSYSFVEWVREETLFREMQAINLEIERSEAECLSCMSILRRIAEKNGQE